MSWIIFVSIFSLIVGYGILFIEYIEIISIPDLAKKFIKISNRVSISCLVVAIAIIVFWPKSNRLKWGISKNQLELKIAPIENELQEIDKESKGKILSDSKLKRVEELNSKAASLRKNYFKGNLVQTPPPNPAPLPVYKWIFEFKPEPKDVINAIKKGVDQICYRENEVLNKPDFSNNEIRFKYKTSKGKVINAILDKKSPSETHFLGMVDLPELPKGRKLIIRLKETSAPDNFDGNIETWDGENWYPVIPAFLKKVQIQ